MLRGLQRLVPEADPAERVVDRRERGDDTEAALELGLQLGERGVGRRLDQPLELAFVRFEARAPVPAVAKARRYRSCAPAASA